MDHQEKEGFEFIKIINSSIRKAFIRTGVVVDGNGNGKYDINILQTATYTGVNNNVAGKIEKGKMILYDANLLTRPAGSYNDAREGLQKLDENDYYLAYITLDEIKKYSKFVDWCLDTDVNPIWCAISLKNNDGYYLEEEAMGFIYSSSCRELDYDKDTYPYLSIIDALDTTGEDQDW